MSNPSGGDSVVGYDDQFDLPLWLAESGRVPWILPIHAASDVRAAMTAVAQRLADEGYVVGAPDLFWRIQRGWAAEHDQEGMTASFELVQRFDVETGVTDAIGAMDHMRALPEVQGGTGVLGFCLGGTLAHLVAANGDPDAFVSYYGSGVAGFIGRLEDITCPALYHFGAKDDFIPMADVEAVVDAVKASGREDVQVLVQPEGRHAFDNHEAPQFHDAASAAAACAATLQFLEDHLHS